MAAGKQFLYQKLAEQIAGQIQSGVYESGQKLPSINTLRKTLNKSVSTVYRAYVELEFMGLIDARPKSGYYVKTRSPLKVDPEPSVSMPVYSAEKDISDYADEIRFAIKQPAFVPLGQATLSPDLLPQKIISKITKAISPRKMQELLCYGRIPGDSKLRQSLAGRMTGIVDRVSPDQIVVTNGCMEAVSISLMAVTKPGDTIAVESPTYFGYMQVLKELKLSIVEIPTHPDQGIAPECFARIVDQHPVKACLLIPNFQNPQGYLMPDDSKRRLVLMAADRGIPLIEDDVYSELYHGSGRPSLLKSFDEQDITITCSSFSKTLCPGFRLGWVVADQEMLERIKKIKFSISMVTSSLPQHILGEFLENNRYDRHLRGLRTRVKNQVLAVAGAVKQYFPKGTSFRLPQGGFVLWIRLPRNTNGLRLYRDALARGITVLPGFLCSYSHNYKRYIRINCGFPFDSNIRNAIEWLGRLAAAQTSGG